MKQLQQLLLTPPGIQSLALEGNQESRIGDSVRRNARIDQSIAAIETAIRELSPLPILTDVICPEPPYFEYFTYCDVLGGILLQASSAEICARIAVQNQITKNQHPAINFEMEWAFDKYALQLDDALDRLDPTPVLFLPGSNLLHTLDQSTLVRITQQPNWLIKPHPVTSEVTLRDIGRQFNYGRVLKPTVSGHQLIRRASMVATTQASEFFILAGLMGLPLVDIGKYEYSWTLAYQQFGVIRSQDPIENKERMESALMHPCSGWLHPSMSPAEIDARIDRYISLAMQMREPFKMVSSQQLTGKIAGLKHWETQVVGKQGPQQME